MPDSKQPDDVATYAAAVRAALAHLPDTERAALLEDLENHLEEVVNESDTPLLERLGRPEDYAAELMLAYGAGDEGGVAMGLLRKRSRALIAAVASTRAYREFRALLPELRPGWWVLRAYLAILILSFFLKDGNNLRPIPNPFSTFGLLETVAMLAAIYASVRIGRRTAPSGIGWRGAAAAVNVAIALLALPVLVEMQTTHYSFPTADSQYFSSAGAGYYGSGFTNVYPYTKDGKPLKDILLYDQDGKPLTIPIKDPNVLTEFPIGADGRPITNAFPLSQRHPNGDPILPPRVALPPSPTSAPSPSPASSTPTPSP
jgi:hypothetical protein